MESLQDALHAIMTRPTPGSLVALQGALLASERQGETVERSLETARRFHVYLCELESKITARDYSDLASRLDILAMGAVALESVVTAEKDKFWQRLFLGGLGESLMVAASRQYVRAWEAETGLVHREAAWYLTDELWRLSSQMQPEISSEQRWQGIQSLISPAYDADVPAPAKAVLLGRVFQILLLTHLAAFLDSTVPE